MTKAIIYTRSASGEQSQIVNQRNFCKAFADCRAMEIVAEYTDNGSGMKIKRPGIKALKKDGKAGKFDVIIVMDFGRISRSIPLLVSFGKWADENGIKILEAASGNYYDGGVFEKFPQLNKIFDEE